MYLYAIFFMITMIIGITLNLIIDIKRRNNYDE